MFCTKCGFNLPQDVKFCPNCGTVVEQTTQQSYVDPVSDTEVTTDPDVEAMVGVKKEYYLPKFRQFRRLNKKTSWNWCAFLFTTMWFIYRKMYLYALGCWGISLLVSAITEGSGGLLVSIASGIFGNWLYMYHLEQRARELALMTPEEKQAALPKKSGVNKGAVIAIVAAEILLIVLLVVALVAFFAATGTSMDINYFINDLYYS